MEADETAFLRDQVQRLNAVLAEYQHKYPSFTPTAAASGQSFLGDRPAAPWLTDKSLLSPLLKEYDGKVHLLQEENGTYKREHKSLKTHLEKLVSENKRLTKELKETVENQLAALGEDDKQEPGSQSDDRILHNLNKQLEMAVKEKELALEMYQEATKELDRMEQEILDQKNSPYVKALEQQANQVKGQFAAMAEKMNGDILQLQDELRQKKTELHAAHLQVIDLKNALDELQSQLVNKEHEKTIVVERDAAHDRKITSQQAMLADLEARLFVSEKDSKQCQQDKQAAEQKLLDMTKQNTENEQKSYEAMMKLRENVQLVENALLEKDQIMVREKQKDTEIQRLNETINTLLEEAGLRTRKEVESVRKQCNINIGKLMEEMQQMEMENSEKQSQIERAVREKRAVESELEKIYQEGLVQGSRDSGTYDELNRRACQAERQRDEVLIKLESINSNMKRTDMNHNQEVSQLKSQLSKAKERVSSMNQEFEAINDERLKNLNEIDELKRRIQSMSQEKDAAQRKCNKQVSCMEQDQMLKEKEYELKLQSAEDTGRHAMSEMRQLLSAQQRMSAKWKEECTTLTRKFEGQVSELRTELGRQKKRNDELVALLNETREKTLQSEKLLADYTRNIKKLETRVRDSETRAADAAKQVSRQLGRERTMMTERRHLQRELEKSRLESTRPAARNPGGPLLLAELNTNMNGRHSPLFMSEGHRSRAESEASDISQCLSGR